MKTIKYENFLNSVRYLNFADEVLILICRKKTIYLLIIYVFFSIMSKPVIKNNFISLILTLMVKIGYPICLQRYIFFFTRFI